MWKKEREREENRGQLKKVETWEGERIGVELLESNVYIVNSPLVAFSFKSTTDSAKQDNEQCN